MQEIERERTTDPTRRWHCHLLRAPVVHFFLVGAVALALMPVPRPIIVLDPGVLAEVRREWSVARGRDPTASENAALLERLVDDEILLREAWSRGVPDRDPIVAERLGRIGNFVSSHGDEEEASPPEPVEQARELGLEQGDLVVRRYLIELMRLAIAREVDATLPSEAELEAHLRENPERFARPAQLRLTQVFLSSRRGAGQEEAARRLQTDLDALAPEEALGRGDPFPVGQEIVSSRERLVQIFGRSFADSVVRQKIGLWNGPIESAYGSHWVWIHESSDASMPPLSEVRSQVLHHWLRTRRAEHLRRRLAELRERYDVHLDDAV